MFQFADFRDARFRDARFRDARFRDARAGAAATPATKAGTQPPSGHTAPSGHGRRAAAAWTGHPAAGFA
ncbi:MAG: pentapeptide repeat-containing protein [Gemmobacter sp.]